MIVYFTGCKKTAAHQLWKEKISLTQEISGLSKFLKFPRSDGQLGKPTPCATFTTLLKILALCPGANAKVLRANMAELATPLMVNDAQKPIPNTQLRDPNANPVKELDVMNLTEAKLRAICKYIDGNMSIIDGVMWLCGCSRKRATDIWNREIGPKITSPEISGVLKKLQFQNSEGKISKPTPCTNFHIMLRIFSLCPGKNAKIVRANMAEITARSVAGDVDMEEAIKDRRQELSANTQEALLEGLSSSDKAKETRQKQREQEGSTLQDMTASIESMLPAGRMVSPLIVKDLYRRKETFFGIDTMFHEYLRIGEIFRNAEAKREADVVEVAHSHELAKLRVPIELATVTAPVDLVKAKTETEKAKTETTKAEVELAKVNAPAELEQAKTETEKARVEQTKAEVELAKVHAPVETEKARVEQTKADVELAKVNAPADLEHAKSETEKARVEQTKAEVELANVNAPADLEQAKTETEKAKVAQTKAEVELAKVNAPVETEKAKAEIAKAKVELAKVNAPMETEKAKAETEKAKVELTKAGVELAKVML